MVSWLKKIFDYDESLLKEYQKKHYSKLRIYYSQFNPVELQEQRLFINGKIIQLEKYNNFYRSLFPIYISVITVLISSALSIHTLKYTYQSSLKNVLFQYTMTKNIDNVEELNSILFDIQDFIPITIHFAIVILNWFLIFFIIFSLLRFTLNKIHTKRIVNLHERLAIIDFILKNTHPKKHGRKIITVNHYKDNRKQPRFTR